MAISSWLDDPYIARDLDQARAPWRQLDDPQRQIGHDTLTIGRDRLVFSTVLKPFMTPLLEQCTPAYETALFWSGEPWPTLTLGATDRAEAEKNHAELVAMFRTVKRARMRRLHTAYRRRRR